MNGPLQGKIWDAELKRPQRELLVLLSWYADSNGGSIYPSIATLAHRLDYDERHIRRLMRDLESAGYIQRVDPKRTRKRTYVYRIVESALKPKSGAPKSEATMGAFSEPGHSELSTRTICRPNPDILGRNPDIQMSPELAVEVAEENKKNSDQVWNEVMKQLEPITDKHTFRVWFKPMQAVGMKDRAFVIRVPHSGYVERCESFKPQIAQELVKAGLSPSEVRFVAEDGV